MRADNQVLVQTTELITRAMHGLETKAIVVKLGTHAYQQKASYKCDTK